MIPGSQLTTIELNMDGVTFDAKSLLVSRKIDADALSRY